MAKDDFIDGVGNVVNSAWLNEVAKHVNGRVDVYTTITGGVTGAAKPTGVKGVYLTAVGAGGGGGSGAYNGGTANRCGGGGGAGAIG